MKHPTFEGKKKGDKLYYCGRELTITAIGRKWVTATGFVGLDKLGGTITRRFDIKTAIVEQMGITFLKQCYATREEMEAAQ